MTGSRSFNVQTVSSPRLCVRPRRVLPLTAPGVPVSLAETVDLRVQHGERGPCRIVPRAHRDCTCAPGKGTGSGVGGGLLRLLERRTRNMPLIHVVGDLTQPVCVVDMAEVPLVLHRLPLAGRSALH